MKRKRGEGYRADIDYLLIWTENRNKGDFVGFILYYVEGHAQFNERHNDRDD